MRVLLTLIGIVGLAACGSMNSNHGDGGGGAGGMGAAGGSGGGGSGGGGGGTSQTDWVSGTRIRARLQTTPDGAKGHYGWYDSQLDIACNFYRAADDTERCLPTDWIASSGSYWADAACSTPLAVAPIGCTPAYVYTFEQTATCSSVSGIASPYRYHVYGGVTPYTATSYWVGSGGATGCTMEPLNPTNAYYTFGAEIVASTFAPGDIVTE